MAKAKFKISPFINPSGATAYRVSGTLHGKVIRKNFKSRQQAMGYRDQMEILYLNGVSRGQSIWTTLTHEQNRDAIAAVSLLAEANSTKSLAFAVRFMLQHFQEAVPSVEVGQAVDAYLGVRAQELAQGRITKRQTRSIMIELKKFKAHFAGRPLGEISSDALIDYLHQPLGRSVEKPSEKTLSNRRGYLATFFKYCHTQRYLDGDPVASIPQYKAKLSRGTATTLSAQQARELMHWLEDYRGKQDQYGRWWGKPGCLVPYFALTLFAGIRPDYRDGEISKLQPADIRFDTKVILIEPGASKVNERRTIKMQPNLQSWLKHYPVETYPIIPGRMKQLLFDARKAHKLAHDVLRHTFISMTVGAFRSIGDASLQAGNSESIIRKHYLDLKSPEEADAFWHIFPREVPVPTMDKRDGRYLLVG